MRLLHARSPNHGLDRARAEYEMADRILPDYAETKLRLGILAESEGDLGRTRLYLNDYLRLSPGADSRELIQPMIDSLEAKRARYDAAVTEARKVLRDLSLQFQSLSTRLQSESLDKIAQILAPAAALFPNGWEVNEILMFVHLQNGNQRLAMRSADLLWASHKPVYFFGAIRPKEKKDASLNGRVHLLPESVRILYSSGRRGILYPLNEAQQPTGPDCESSLDIPLKSIRRVDTVNDSVHILLGDGREYFISPFFLMTPFQLPSQLRFQLPKPDCQNIISSCSVRGSTVNFAAPRASRKSRKYSPAANGVGNL